MMNENVATHLVNALAQAVMSGRGNEVIDLATPNLLRG
jgi:hypothetical protein